MPALLPLVLKLAAAVLLGTLALSAGDLEPDQVAGAYACGKALHGRDLLEPGTSLKGVVLKPGLVLKGAALAGRDLREATLAGVDFMGTSLAGADLRRADLRGASLVGVDLTGAKLEGANIVGANLVGAKLDAPLGKMKVLAEEKETTAAVAAPRLQCLPLEEAGAGIHLDRADLAEFFAPDLGKGSIKLLALPEDAPMPGGLMRMFGGVAWLGGPASKVRLLHPDGLAWVPLGTKAAQGAGDGAIQWFLDPEGRDLSWYRLFDQPYNAVPRLKVGALQPFLDEVSRPDLILAATAGHGVLFDKAAFRMKAIPVSAATACRTAKAKAKTMVWTCFKGDPDDPFLSLCGAPLDTVLVQSKRRVRIVDLADPGWAYVEVDLPPDPLRRFLLTREGRFWHTTPDGELARIDLKTGESTFYRLPAGRGMIGTLAQGPGETLWFTLPQARRICCLDPEKTSIRSIVLPLPGSAPYELLDAGDGSLFFTLRGRRMLGRIGMVEPLPPAPLAAAAPPAAPAPTPPVRRRRGKVNPFDRWQAAEAKAPEPQPPVAEKPAPPPPATREEVLKTLAGQGILDVDLPHILAEHRFGADNGKGQYTKADSCKEERILERISAALEREDYPLIYDTEGGVFVVGEFPTPVGFVRKGGQWAETNRLKVVLSRDQSRVVTAYPVDEF